ncbi:hypothetical protein M407DRAFT_27945 [Tulasnella calospora MUT 4182]|uniref:F-box domain-containing protein n=1 Tax=Tulasnella calospora MUT 4182 TaxID=1051891 RepID=A0A0C3Q2A6_9AGAM|nr:hypothetical protein M407DRAFT_27945 [Tulasnella calospora MUT 4182]
MDQNNAADQASSFGREKTNVGTVFNNPGNHVDTRLQPQDASPSIELALGRRHNAALPIHSLPAEVFVQVIRLHMLLVLDLETDGEDYYVHLFRLSGVCSHWHHVIRDSPPLWTRLNLSKPPQVVEIALQSSSSHLLDIVYHSQTTPYRLVKVALARFQSNVDAVRPHRDRWRSMHMDISASDLGMEDAIEILKEPAPILEKLSLIDQTTMCCTLESDLFGGNAPRLKNLTLDGVSIPWDSEVLHDLMFLSLSYIMFPSTDVILHALSHSPKLQKLHIVKCRTKSMATPSSPFVQLSQLLWLGVNLRGATEDFLDHIICNVKNSDAEAPLT